MYDMGCLRNIGVGSALVAVVFVTGCETTVRSYTVGGEGGMGGKGVTSSSSGAAGMAGAAGAGGAGGMGATGGMGGTGGILPTCEMGKTAQFVMNQMFLGDTDPDGTPNPTNGWKQYGFNIDGRISTKLSTDLCKPVAGGSPAAVYPDGNEGIDNSFGKNVLPMILGLASDLSTTLNQSIANGEFSYLLSLENADQDACATSSSFFLGGNLKQIPKFDGSDVWPIDASSLLDPLNPASAKCAFSNTRLEGGIVHAGPPSQFNLILRISGFDIVLPIGQARVAFKLDPGFPTISAGQIGGVVRTEDLVQEIAKVAAAFDVSFCDPQSPTLMSILNQMRQASDIMQDGTQDPSKECDGISIGIGFTMKSTQFGAVVPAVPPPPDPCMP